MMHSTRARLRVSLGNLRHWLRHTWISRLPFVGLWRAFLDSRQIPEATEPFVFAQIFFSWKTGRSFRIHFPLHMCLF